MAQTIRNLEKTMTEERNKEINNIRRECIDYAMELLNQYKANSDEQLQSKMQLIDEQSKTISTIFGKMEQINRNMKELETENRMEMDKQQRRFRNIIQKIEAKTNKENISPDSGIIEKVRTLFNPRFEGIVTSLNNLHTKINAKECTTPTRHNRSNPDYDMIKRLTADLQYVHGQYTRRYQKLKTTSK